MTSSAKKTSAWALVAILAVVHYDFWFWTDRSLVFGFMPIGLFFHALISLGAGIAWALVVSWGWPSWVEEWADQTDSDSRGDDR